VWFSRVQVAVALRDGETMNFIDPSIWLLTILGLSLGILGAWCWWMMRRIWG